MRWLEISSRVDGEAVEAVSEVFTRVATAGVAVEPDLVPGPDDGCTLGSLATVRGYLLADEQAEAKTRTIAEALWHLRAIWPIGDLSVREIAEEDWANSWKQHFATFRVGQRLVIRPSWLDDAPRAGDVVVTLDPGAAFGTGLHPTTRRCLEILEAVIRPGDTVLDVGTGSGILALAAAGLQAARVVAVDNDPIAVSTARQNVALSQMAERILVLEGSVDAAPSTERYDVVVANIIARVILELAPALADRLRPTGTLVVGGIIADRGTEVANALVRLGLDVQRYVDGDWIVFAGHRPGSA